MTQSDRTAVQALWRERFGDSEPFMDWFFGHRFRPETSVCLTLDQKLVCAAQGLILPVCIRGQVFTGLMVSGVSTAPGYEKRGYMHRVMRCLMQLGRSYGCAAVFYKPAHLSTFFSIGHLPCTETQRLKRETGASLPEYDSSWDASLLLDCYLDALRPYSAYAFRSRADMELKLWDYRSDGAKLITLKGTDRLDGYAVVFPTGQGYTGEEVLARSASDYIRLLELTPANTQMKLPPDLRLGGETYCQNVMGLINAPVLLKALIGRRDVFFSVHDPVVPQNEGIFDGLGNRVRHAPDFSLSAGELMQSLSGYLPLPGLLDKTPCYCVDEY